MGYMPKRDTINKLTPWEVSLVKAMLLRGDFRDQKIQAYFTRPDRTINHARIGEIRKQQKHKNIKAATAEQLHSYLVNFPNANSSDPKAKESRDLATRSRQAMQLAVQAFNNPIPDFRAEAFIVLAIIAWTYLLHAYLRVRGVDYRYYRQKDGKKEVEKTKSGSEKYWELGKCIEDSSCPLDEGTKNNLRFLVEIRHEIEHRMTENIDDAISAKLQACCLNFDRTIRMHFGEKMGVDGSLAVALQFSTFRFDQSRQLLGATDQPAKLPAIHSAVETSLSEEERKNPNFSFRVAMIQRSANNKGGADQVVEFISPESAEGQAISRVLLKEVEKNKFKPRQVVKLMHDAGFKGFGMHQHTELWKKLNAKDPHKKFGVLLGDGQWYWYQNWVDEVQSQLKRSAKKSSS